VVARALSLLSTMAGHSREEPNVERGLTRREREIMGHTVGGLSNREIADRMAIRTSTVKAHLTSVFRKLSVRDRTQLVVLYHHHSGSDQAARGASVAHGSFLRA
jgi:DNA-binding NarL/FixJ family response regulator